MITIRARATSLVISFLLAAAGMAFAQADVEYSEAWGDNLAAESNGGYIESFSSESSPDVAANLIDGSADEACHWEPIWSDGRPYYVTIGLESEALVAMIAITSNPEDSSGGRPAKVVVSTGIADPEDLAEIGTFDLDDEEMQVITLPKPVRAQYVRLSFEADYGESGGEIGEIAIFGKAAPSGYAGAEDSDILYLRDGSRIAGASSMQSVDIQAFGQKISVPASDALWVEFGVEEGRLDRIFLKNGDAISGVVSVAKIGLKLKSGVDLSIARERVVAVGFRLKDTVKKASGSFVLLLVSGDELTGRILNDKLVVVTPYGPVSLPAKEVSYMERLEGSASTVLVSLLGGDQIAGYLAEEAVRIDLDIGPVVSLHPEILGALYRAD